MIYSQIKINEFLASNTTTYADSYGEYDDWVELKNTGASPINIGGYFLSDTKYNLTQWQVPTSNPFFTTINPGQYIIIWLDNQTSQGILHAKPKLSASGEQIVLVAPDGITIVDSISFGPQTSDISTGRIPDGTGAFTALINPSPNSVNIYVPPIPSAAMPVANINAGFYTSAQTISLSTTTLGATIRYTLDGSMPTSFSPVYTSPIIISATQTLRAIAFASGMNPSDVMTNTYFININHVFPIVSLSSSPDYFFDTGIGIFPNYTLDIEHPLHFEVYENYIQTFESDATVKVVGTGSASQLQKSMSVDAPSGQTFNHAFFSNYPYTTYEQIMLRNSGQDWNITMFRDALVSGLIREFDDVKPRIKNPAMDMQGYNPGVAYINGQYWGIYNIRERMTDVFIKTHYNLNASEIDLIENDNEIKNGDLTEWSNLTSFVSTTNFSSNTNFNLLKDQIDIDNFLDYNVFNIYVDNYDWPSNNNRRWRERKAGKKWHWLCFDYDFSVGLYQAGGGWNTGDASPNSLLRAVDSTSAVWPNASWSTLLFRRCLQNQQFKVDFINRMADMMNIVFDSVRINTRTTDYQTLYAPEIQKHFDKWNGGWAGNWLPSIQNIKNFSNARPAYMQQHVIDYFTEVTGIANITLQANPTIGGTVHISTLTTPSNLLPFNGTYFSGIDIPLHAIPNSGYYFDSWSDVTLGNTANTSVLLTSDKSITANFLQGSTSTLPIIINEINYNSSISLNAGDWIELYNPNPTDINIEGWYLQDESTGYFPFSKGTIIPANGYLILAEDTALFYAVYPGINGLIGNFGDGYLSFKCSNSGEALTLKNGNHVLIDSVKYLDIAPWPIDPDGNGPTLQLISPLLDNVLASSWTAIPATPGMQNIVIVKQDQDITIMPIADKYTTDLPFSITAVSTSLLPVTISVFSGPATIAGNTVTLDGIPGIVTIKASQSGDIYFNAAPDMYSSFNVNLLTSNFSSTENSAFIVYPNPVNNHLIVSGKLSVLQNTKLELFNALGEKVYNQIFPANAENILIQTHFLPAGMYMLKTNDQHTSPIKIIISR